MMRKTTFKGANVFISRNLVPPEIFDSLHDVLKDNGAEIFLCCDPSRNGPDDYHVIASRDHVYAYCISTGRYWLCICKNLEFTNCSQWFLQEKFNDLRQKGCNLIGMAVSLPFQVPWSLFVCSYLLSVTLLCMLSYSEPLEFVYT